MTADTFDTIARQQIWDCLDRLVKAGHTIELIDGQVQITPAIDSDLLEALDASWHDVRDWLAERP